MHMTVIVFCCLITGQIQPSDSTNVLEPVAATAMLEAVDPAWLTSPGVREISLKPGGQFLVATGVASLNANLPRSTAERVLVVRARLDALRRLVEYGQPQLSGQTLVIEGVPRGVREIARRMELSDPRTLYLTIAIRPDAMGSVAVRPIQPRMASPPASAPSVQELGLTDRVAVAAGTIVGAVRDAVTTTPEKLLDQARRELDAEKEDQAIESISRAERICANRTAAECLRAELDLRDQLRRNPASEEALFALAQWADKYGRLSAVAAPLARSAQRIVEDAGDEAFVQNPAIFFFVARAEEDAGHQESAVRWYLKSIRFGPDRPFCDEARRRLARLRLPLNNTSNRTEVQR